MTQLFRLSSSTTDSTTPSIAALAVAVSSDSSLSSSEFLSLQQALADHARRLDAMSLTTLEAVRYRNLAKPVGGTFIALALVFLVLGKGRNSSKALCTDRLDAGSHRFFRNQEALMRSPSMFAPSRRSVIASSFFVGMSPSSFLPIPSNALSAQLRSAWHRSLPSCQLDELGRRMSRFSLFFVRNNTQCIWYPFTIGTRRYRA